MNTTTAPLRPVPATAVRTFGPRQRTSAARVRARATWPDLRGLHIATVRGTTFVSWTAGPQVPAVALLLAPPDPHSLRQGSPFLCRSKAPAMPQEKNTITIARDPKKLVFLAPALTVLLNGNDPADQNGP